MAGEPIKLTRQEVEKWKESPHKQQVLAEMKKQDPPVQQQSKQAPVKKTPPVQQASPQPKPKPKSRWESVKERILGSKEKEKHERREREHHGRVSSKSIYKDGKLVEKIHYGPAKEPRQPKPRRMPRGDPLGGIGAGMGFGDFLPSNRGTGLGGMMPYPGFSDPFGRSAPSSPRRGKKGSRRQPRDEPFDYIDHMNTMPESWRRQMW